MEGKYIAEKTQQDGCMERYKTNTQPKNIRKMLINCLTISAFISAICQSETHSWSWFLFYKSSHLESLIQIDITQINKIKYITTLRTLDNEFFIKSFHLMHPHLEDKDFLLHILT